MAMMFTLLFSAAIVTANQPKDIIYVQQGSLPATPFLILQMLCAKEAHPDAGLYANRPGASLKSDHLPSTKLPAATTSPNYTYTKQFSTHTHFQGPQIFPVTPFSISSKTSLNSAQTLFSTSAPLSLLTQLLGSLTLQSAIYCP
jgi:hypothetical protein